MFVSRSIVASVVNRESKSHLKFLIYVITDTTLSHHHPVSHIIIFHARTRSRAHSLIFKFCSGGKRRRNKKKLQTIPELMHFFTIRFQKTCFAAPPSCWGDTDEN